MGAYELAAAAFSSVGPLRSLAPAPGTFDALAVAYYRSPNFLALAPITQRTNRNRIDRWRKKHGAKRVVHLERRHIAEHMGEWLEKGGPGAANNLLKAIGVLCNFAIEHRWRQDNPCIGMKRFKRTGDGFVTWSDSDVAAFLEHWPAGSRERMALCLLLYTGQRRGDVVRMGRQHIADDTIRVKQSKTGAQLVIPLHPELKVVLDSTHNEHLTFLTTARGAPFSSASFGNWFRDACKVAGLHNRTAHGLRKTAATRLADAGCTTKQIQAITGHATMREVERYTKAADQERLAREAIARLILNG